MDRKAKTVRERHQHPSSGRSVQLGHNQAGNVGDLTENLNLPQRVLTCRRVKYQERVMGRGVIPLADDTNDLSQLLHQVSAVLQPTGRIDHQQIRTLGLGARHRVKGKAGGIRTLRSDHHRHTGAVTPDLELLHRRRPERVARRDHHGLAGSPELAGELTDGCGLPGAVDPDNQHRLRSSGVERHRLGDRFHDPGDLIREKTFHLLDAEALSRMAFGDVARHPERGVNSEIRRDQQLLQTLQHPVIKNAPAHRRPRAATQYPPGQSLPLNGFTGQGLRRLPRCVGAGTAVRRDGLFNTPVTDYLLKARSEPGR